jgi:hypothetical protein
VEAGLSLSHRLEAALPVGSCSVHERTQFVERAGSLAPKTARYLLDHVGLLRHTCAPSCLFSAAACARPLQRLAPDSPGGFAAITAIAKLTGLVGQRCMR